MKGSAFKCEEAYYFLLPDQAPPFWVSNAGITNCDETYLMKREFSSTTVIEYIYSGTGTLWVEQNEYHPSAGDIYILPEHSKHTYYPDPKNPWKKIFVNLRGTAVSGLIQAFGLHQRILYHQCGEMAPIFEKIFEIVQMESPAETIMDECAMQIMKLLISLHRHEMNNPDLPNEVQTIRRFIDSNYFKNLTMGDISTSIYRSNDYTKKRFKQYYGTTPYAYYLDLKLMHAKYMLRRTNLSVKQIADRLGYKSDRYFSRRFKESVGMTATQYRRLNTVTGPGSGGGSE